MQTNGLIGEDPDNRRLSEEGEGCREEYKVKGRCPTKMQDICSQAMINSKTYEEQVTTYVNGLGQEQVVQDFNDANRAPSDRRLQDDTLLRETRRETQAEACGSSEMSYLCDAKNEVFTYDDDTKGTEEIPVFDDTENGIEECTPDWKLLNIEQPSSPSGTYCKQDPETDTVSKLVDTCAQWCGQAAVPVVLGSPEYGFALAEMTNICLSPELLGNGGYVDATARRCGITDLDVGDGQKALQRMTRATVDFVAAHRVFRLAVVGFQVCRLFCRTSFMCALHRYATHRTSHAAFVHRLKPPITW